MGAQCCSPECRSSCQLLQRNGAQASSAPIMQRPVVGEEGGEDCDDSMPQPVKKKKSVVKKGGESQQQELENFRAFLKPKYETPEEAWKEMFGVSDLSVFVRKDDLVRKIQDMSYTGNAELVGNTLCDSGGIVTFESLREFLAPTNVFADAMNLGLVQGRRASADANLGNVHQGRRGSRGSAGQMMPDQGRRGSRDHGDQGRRGSRGSASVPPDFKQFLKSKFNSVNEAWRELTRNTSGDALKKDDFVKRMEKLGYKGDATSLFACMDDDNDGSVTDKEFKQCLAASSSAARNSLNGTAGTDGRRRSSAAEPGGRRGSVKGKRNSVLPEVETTLDKNNAVSFKLTPQIVESISDALLKHMVCFKLEAGECKNLARQMKLLEFKDGDDICREGESGQFFFIAKVGELKVFKNKAIVGAIPPGVAFGEVALMQGGGKRTATIRAGQDKTQVWAVDRKTFKSVLEKTEARSYEENRRFINSVQLFDSLSSAQKDKLVEQAIITQVFEPGKYVFYEGDKGESLYIVKAGDLAILIGGSCNKEGIVTGAQEVAKLQSGHMFGERALIYGQARAATVRANTRSTLLCLNHDLLRKHLGNELDNLLRRVLALWAMRESVIFSRFNSKQQVAILESMDEFKLSAGNPVKASSPLRFFIVLQGDAVVTEKNSPTVTYGRGMFFGDDYIKEANKQLTATIKAGPQGCEIKVLHQKNFAGTLKILGFPANGNIEETLAKNSRIEVTRKIWLFRHLPDYQILRLAEEMTSMNYPRGRLVIKEGDPGTGFFVIASGEVMVSKGGKVLVTLAKHQYFGERALIFGEPRNATVEVSTEVAELWCCAKSSFEAVVNRKVIDYLSKEVSYQDKNLELNDMERKCILAKGAHGNIKMVLYPTKKMRYALKCAKLKALTEAEQLDAFRRECEILAELDHPFIVRLVRSFEGNAWAHLMTELVTGGTLQEATLDGGLGRRISIPQAKFYIGSLFLVIEYLHSLYVVHRNLKPDNVMLDNTGYLKVIDFGTAKKVAGKTYTTVGSAHYMAPEVIRGKGYGAACDMWSIGVLLYSLLCGELPYGEGVDDQLEVCRRVLAGSLEKDLLPPAKPSHAAPFCRSLLAMEPESRMGSGVNGATDIRKHAFFTEEKGAQAARRASGVSSDDISYFDQLLSRALEPPYVPKKEILKELDMERDGEEDDISSDEGDSEDNSEEG